MKVTWLAFKHLSSFFKKKKGGGWQKLPIKESAEMVETGVRCRVLAEETLYHCEHFLHALSKQISSTFLLIRRKGCFLLRTEISIKTKF